MAPDCPTAAEIRDTLYALRYAKPLAGSRLLGLGLVTQRLRAEGVTNTPETREWMLGRLLGDVVWEELSRCRGSKAACTRAGLTPEREIGLLRDDFSAGSPGREAWGMLYFRFFADHAEPMTTASEAVGLQKRTLRRRLSRGYQALADLLRGAEREAERTVTRPHNLPQLLTRFIGREREIAEVRSLLVDHRLVTLTGVGGVGKSRLAVEVAKLLAQDYRHGAWMVELGAVEDGNLVVPTVAAAFGLKEQPRRLLIDVLKDYFEAKQLLLVLDNCEHLVEACAEVAEILLQHCPDLQMLATSRERLHCAGEAVFLVPSLSLPDDEHRARPAALMHFDSVRLFIDRAGSAMPGFQVTADNAPHVADICAAVDGIPLATEMAAGRVSILSPQELAQRLAASLELLKDGRRSMRPQHETLRATMDWSHSLLEEREKVLFRRLSVFRGGWTLEAVEEVSAGNGLDSTDVLDLLHHLVDKSLVTVRGESGERRYGILRTVRQYAEEKLALSGETEETHRRHLLFYTALAERAKPELHRADQLEWFRRLSSEQSNLRVALGFAHRQKHSGLGHRLAAALGEFFLWRGLLTEGRHAIGQILEGPWEAIEPAQRASCLHAAGKLAVHRWDNSAARELFEAANEICISGNLPDRHGILNGLGIVAHRAGDRDAALAFYNSALENARSSGDTIGIASSLLNLGAAAAASGDLETAKWLASESSMQFRADGDMRSAALADSNLAGISAEAGDIRTARQSFLATLELNLELNDAAEAARALLNLGWVAVRLSKLEAARGYYLKAQATYEELGSKIGLARSLGGLGMTYLNEGRLDEARRAYERSLGIRRQMEDTSGVISSLAAMAELEWRAGNCNAAGQLVGESLTLMQTTTTLSSSCFVLSLSGAIAAQEDRVVEALRQVGAATAQLSRSGVQRRPQVEMFLDAIESKARAALDQGAHDAAYGEGAALTLDEAIAYALGDVTWDELAPVVAERLATGEAAGDEPQEDRHERKPPGDD